MINRLIILILLLNLYTIEGVEYIHPNSDTTHKSDSIRVDAYLDFTGDDIFYGSRIATGLLAWRDWLEEKGGVCLSRSSTATSKCPSRTEQKKVTLRIIDWAKGDSKETRAKKLYDKGYEICQKAIKIVGNNADSTAKQLLIPHFLIAPYGDELVQQLRNGMLDGSKKAYENNPNRKYKLFGCNITVIVPTAEEETLKNNIQLFMYSISNANPKSIKLSGFEFFSRRNTAITYALLSSSTGEGYLLAKRVEKAFKVNLYKYKQLSNIKQVMKRCSHEATSPYAVSCYSDSDCIGDNNKCEFARHNGDYEELVKWIKVLKKVKPHVIIFSDVENIPIFVELVEKYQLSPSGIMVTTPADYTELNSTSWTYLTQYSQFDPTTDKYFIGGDKYMGNNLEFKALIKEKLKEYLYDGLISAPSETSMDIEYAAMGAACGVTVQRAIELAAQGADDEKYLPDDQFNTQSTARMYEILTGFGECGYASSGSGTASWTGEFCQDDTTCGAGVSCIYWESFYGVIHFGSESHMNEEGELLLMQVYENISDVDNTTIKLSKIIGPSTNDVCNSDYHWDCANEENWICQCEGEYPARFSWLFNKQIKKSMYYVIMLLVIVAVVGYFIASLFYQLNMPDEDVITCNIN